MLQNLPITFNKETWCKKMNKETDMYQRAGEALIEAQRNNKGLILLTDKEENMIIVLHRLSAFEIAQMLYSVLEDKPEIKLVLLAMLSGKLKRKV